MDKNIQIKLRKKLIEVAIPLESINSASAREKSIRHGHPNTLHVWWARRPLCAARAVIFCQMVDDPSSVPEEFPLEEEQNKERKRLFKLIEELVEWENINNNHVLNKANKEIKKSWERCCSDNRNHHEAKKLFNPDEIPSLHDPFAGGGGIPLEAQRLGLNSFATDLNPVAVLINKAMIELPSRFINKESVNPESKNLNYSMNCLNSGYEGLSQDLTYYGNWIKKEAEKRISHLYPKVLINSEMVKERPDLKIYEGQQLRVIAWLWARTVKSPNPSFCSIDVPLLSTFILSSKKGKEAYIKPIINNSKYTFKVCTGKPSEKNLTNGTKISRGIFKCILSNTPIDPHYVREEARKGKLGQKLFGMVLEGKKGRIYIDPQEEHEKIADVERYESSADINFFEKALGFRIGNYGMSKWSDLFSSRQLLALTTFSDLVKEVKEKIFKDSLKKMTEKESKIYCETIAIYLAFCVDRLANRLSTLCVWNRPGEKIEQTFRLQVLSMTWDFAEANVFSRSTGGWDGQLEWIPNAVLKFPTPCVQGKASQGDAKYQEVSNLKIISTDPPYFDNVGYSDLSDFFYVWLRRSLKDQFPKLFKTISTPKSDELVATPDRHGGKDKAYDFFLEGMTKALSNSCLKSHPAYLSTIFYAFKQTQSSSNGKLSSTGWESFLESIISSGLTINASWPLRTELTGGLRSLERNSLSTSLVLVCGKKDPTFKSISKIEFKRKLINCIPKTIIQLQNIGLNPADIHQGVIGAGMKIYSSVKNVINSDDSFLSVREALLLINNIYDESISGNEHLFDSDTYFALTIFQTYGYSVQPFGIAENIAKRRNISVKEVERAGIISATGGNVRLIKRDQYQDDWDPNYDKKLCIWESTQHLIRRLELQGEKEAAKLLFKLKNIYGRGDLTSNCKSLAYILFNHCEKTNQAEEARSYNSLINSWTELEKLSLKESSLVRNQKELF